MTNIAENLQLRVKDVHIRYEDDITIPRQSFAFGITIESLSAQSCDADWIPGFTTQWTTSSSAFKLVELTNMAMYWDPIEPPSELLGNMNMNQLAVCIELEIKNFII